MGFFDKLFGRKEEQQRQHQGPVHFGDGPATGLTNPHAAPQYGGPNTGATTRLSTDEQAVARYRYLLQTAPPEQIEQAHAEAFANLTPQQRTMVLQGLAEHVPASEQQTLAAAQNDPRAMARLATRAEMRQPGTLERAFGGPGYGQQGGMGGMMGGMGGMIAGTLLASVAGAFIGTAIADAMLNDFGDPLAEEMPAEDMAMEEPMPEEEFGDFGGDMGDMGGFEEF
jgi:hypothetical protein